MIQIVERVVDCVYIDSLTLEISECALHLAQVTHHLTVDPLAIVLNNIRLGVELVYGVHRVHHSLHVFTYVLDRVESSPSGVIDGLTVPDFFDGFVDTLDRFCEELFDILFKFFARLGLIGFLVPFSLCLVETSPVHRAPAHRAPCACSLEVPALDATRAKLVRAAQLDTGTRFVADGTLHGV